MNINKNKENEINFYKSKGNQFFIEGNYTKAIEYYTKAIEVGSESFCLSKLYSNRANCYQLIEDYEKALFDCDMCISLSEKWFKGYYRKACVLLKKNNLSDAELNFKISLSLALKEEEKSEIKKMIQQVKKKRLNFLDSIKVDFKISEQEESERKEQNIIQDQVDWLMSQFIKPYEEDAFRCLAVYHGVDQGSIPKESVENWLKFSNKYGFGDSEDLAITLQNYLSLTDSNEILKELSVIKKLSGL